VSPPFTAQNTGAVGCSHTGKDWPAIWKTGAREQAQTASIHGTRSTPGSAHQPSTQFNLVTNLSIKAQDVATLRSNAGALWVTNHDN